jgi:hypothetical protein
MEEKMDINEFKQNLGLAELPAELEKLIYFQTNESNKKGYSDGFIIRIDKKDGLKSWCKEDGFLNRLLPFARANASGSFYALWIDDNNKPLNRLPVVVFGDEGGGHIVAENILQLMHLRASLKTRLVFRDALQFCAPGRKTCYF